MSPIGDTHLCPLLAIHTCVPYWRYTLVSPIDDKHLCPLLAINTCVPYWRYTLVSPIGGTHLCPLLAMHTCVPYWRYTRVSPIGGTHLCPLLAINTFSMLFANCPEKQNTRWQTHKLLPNVPIKGHQKQLHHDFMRKNPTVTGIRICCQPSTRKFNLSTAYYILSNRAISLFFFVGSNKIHKG